MRCEFAKALSGVLFHKRLWPLCKGRLLLANCRQKLKRVDCSLGRNMACCCGPEKFFELTFALWQQPGQKQKTQHLTTPITQQSPFAKMCLEQLLASRCRSQNRVKNKQKTSRRTTPTNHVVLMQFCKPYACLANKRQNLHSKNEHDFFVFAI